MILPQMIKKTANVDEELEGEKSKKNDQKWSKSKGEEW